MCVRLAPLRTGDVDMSDSQGALLTTLFTVSYSLVLPLAGSLVGRFRNRVS